MTFACTIPGDPRGKGSVRVYNGRAMKDKRTSDYMGRCVYVMHAAHEGRPPIEEPTELWIVARIARPARLIPKPRMRNPPPSGPMFAPVLPDFDNIAKAVCDSLTQAGVIVDDRRIVRATVTKLYVAVGEAPRVDVRLETIHGFTS